MGRRWSESAIAGVHIGEAFAAADARGSFVKAWARSVAPRDLKLDEVFFSISDRGVIRGMHVQKGRAAGHRLVFATHGSARDFIIDLRVGSPTFGDVVETLLEPGGRCLFIPPGCAHGFESLVDVTTMVYVQEGGHDVKLDVGVHWTSCGLVPRTDQPVVSDRDDALPVLSAFESPFVWTS